MSERLERFMRYTRQLSVLNLAASGMICWLFWSSVIHNWVGAYLAAASSMFLVFPAFNWLITYLLTKVIYGGDQLQLIKDFDTAKDENRKERELLQERYDSLTRQLLPPPVQEVSGGDQVVVTVVDMPDVHCGIYKDAKIYDWLDVRWEQEGVTLRVVWHSTMDMDDKSYELPEDCLLFPPGIVYKVEGPSPIAG